MNSGVVLQLITGLGVGGAERVVMELAGAMSKHGQSVMVASLTDEKRILGQYPHPVFPIFCLGIRKRSPISFIKALIYVIRLVLRDNVRVIHAHMFHAMIFALLCKLCTGNRVSVVFTSHSFAGFKGVRRILIRLTRGLRSADVVFSKVQHTDLNSGKTFVIPNGVRVPRTVDRRRVGEKRIFLFVGRLEEPKDPIALIEAFAQVDDKKCELWMAGDGSLRDTLVRRIAALGLTDRVKLLGVRTDVAELFGKVDCFVMSSRWEGLPMALLEAGAAGLPVISTPVGAIPEVVDEISGFLCSSVELANAINLVVENYDAACQRGKELSRRISERYSLSAMCEKHIRVYSAFNV